METGFLLKLKKWNSWASPTCSRMIFEGSSLEGSFLSVSSLTGVLSCALDILEKNKLLKLKATTNKDLKRLDTIPALTFGRKDTGGGSQIKNKIKKELEKGWSGDGKAGSGEP